MLKRFRPRLTYANVASTLALTVALGTGGAYAANTIGSADVIDESIQSVDIKNGEVKNADIGADAMTSSKLANGSVQNSDLGPDAVTTSKIKAGNVGGSDIADNAILTGKILDGNVFTNDLADGAVSNAKLAGSAVTSAKVLDDTQPGGGLDQTDLATNSVGSSEIQTDAVNATEIADNTIDTGEIVDFGLSNQDIGVLYAQVNADGTIFSSSGGVIGTRNGTGTYAIDFGRDIDSCAYYATQGEGSVGGAAGAIMGVTDRSGNDEAVFVTARTNANVLADRAFQLLVVC